MLRPAPLRDLLIRVARAGLVRARWSELILDECFRSLLRTRPELAEPLRRTRELMIAAIPDFMVEGHESLIDRLVLPDADDRHALAAAVHSGADAIVTFYLADFLRTSLSPYQMEAEHPDDFIMELIDAAPMALAIVVAGQARDLRSPPRSVNELLETLRGIGLPMSAARLKELG